MSRTNLLCLFFLLFTRSAVAAPEPPTIELQGDAQAGAVTVHWSAPKAAGTPVFQVEVARAPGFDPAQRLYEGKHTQTVASGLRDGSVYYRARYQSGDSYSDWSRPAEFVVAHPPLSIAFSLFAIGAVVFVSTAVVVVRGSREATDG